MNETTRKPGPRILPAGDAALVVELGDGIDPRVNRRVHVLARALEQEPLPGLGEALPTYRSLLLHYDPLLLSYEQAAAFVHRRLQDCRDLPPSPPLQEGPVEIPTLYGGAHGPDLPFIAERSGLPVEEVVRLHAGATYTVYMLGFMPGFAYLGGLPQAIAAPRLDTPRRRVPGGSVGIAGVQTGIYPLASPGGWRLIGRTSLALFDPRRDPPALLAPGDQVRFVPVAEED